nr:glutamate--tRNA ligase [Bacteroidota bacterium]
MERKVRVRFAPSPTGPLHIGGMRTALYNYLFARQQGGDFLLRIEDTDQGRFVPGAEDYIIEALKWCNISPNEGIGFGDGPHAPYRQSARKIMYREYVDKLIESGNAYYAFDTAEELEALRKNAEANKSSFAYNANTRKSLINSITLTTEECEKKLKNGDHFVVRFKIPELGQVMLKDIVRGDVVVEVSSLDDKVLFKSDGMPTYHLANVVDDYLMQITHVIRGEEWLPSAPLHVLLYRSFGWEQVMPQFAHLPLLLKPDGNGKLSKRDGDRLGFPVFPLNWTDPFTGEVSSGYRERGYSPEAFANMIAVLGWHPTGEQELFSMDEMIKQFSLERVHKAGAKFDPEKTKWFNQQYLKKQTDIELAQSLSQYIEKQPKYSCIEESRKELVFLETVCKLMREKVHFVHEIFDMAPYFFFEPQSYDESVISKKWNDDAEKVIQTYLQSLQTETEVKSNRYEELFKATCADLNLKDGQFVQILRVCITGMSGGAALYDTMALLGNDIVIARLKFALNKLS